MSETTTQDRDALLREGLRLITDQIEQYTTGDGRAWPERAEAWAAVAAVVRRELQALEDCYRQARGTGDEQCDAHACPLCAATVAAVARRELEPPGEPVAWMIEMLDEDGEPMEADRFPRFVPASEGKPMHGEGFRVTPLYARPEPPSEHQGQCIAARAALAAAPRAEPREREDELFGRPIAVVVAGATAKLRECWRRLRKEAHRLEATGEPVAAADEIRAVADNGTNALNRLETAFFRLAPPAEATAYWTAAAAAPAERQGEEA